MKEELLSIELQDPELQPLLPVYVVQRVQALETENTKLKEYIENVSEYIPEGLQSEFEILTGIKLDSGSK
jgi:hypothetical protein